MLRDGTDKRNVLGLYGWPDTLTPDRFDNVADRDGDRVDEIALIATRNDDGRRQVVIKSSVTRQTIQTYVWADGWSDTSVHEIPDITGDGLSDYGLLGNNRNSGAAQLVVLDSATGDKLSPFTWADMDASLATLVMIPDLDGDGLQDIGLYDQGVLEIKSSTSANEILKRISW